MAKICKNRYNRNICPKTVGQLYYCQSLRKNDIVLLAGKGHEMYQIIENEKKPFDERQIVKEYFNIK